ncbi:hypothetical protein CLU79DRAFT_723551 [Phycomyces nitens]|nr:hypothetical protein CLU79DRAFT_723551 [Phycomyces nitens]
MADDYFFEILNTLPTTTMDLSEEQKELILKRALGDIQSRLQVTGHNLSDYPTMPQEFVTDMGDIPILEALEMAEKRGYDAEEERQALEVVQRMFNTEQKIAYDQIVASLNLFENPIISKVNG